MPYLDSMQIDLYLKNDENEPENIERIRNVASEMGYEDRMTYFRIAPDAIRSSRAGNSPNSKVSASIEELCRLPLVEMIVRPDGKISLCCNDALGQMTLGDLNTETIEEVWYGEKYAKIRDLAMKGREKISLCQYCNAIHRRELDK